MHPERMREHLENRIMTKRSKIKKKRKTSEVTKVTGKKMEPEKEPSKRTENLVMQRYA